MTDILESEALSPADEAIYAEAIAFARERHDGQRVGDRRRRTSSTRSRWGRCSLATVRTDRTS